MRIEDTTPDRVLSRALFGTNLQWEHGGDGILAAIGPPSRFHEDAVDAFRETGLTSVRFPGGSLSNTYQWWTAIGPQDRRSDGFSFAGNRIPSLFGTDELLALCALLQASPVLTVNSSWPYSKAVDWVEYVNRPQSDLPAQFWEIGNEVYSPNEHGFTSAEEYAKRANAFAAAMKAADPAISIGAVVESSFQQAAWMKDVFPHLLTWNEAIISELSADIDFLSLHFYAPYDKLSSDKALSELVLAGPIVFRQNVEEINRLLRKHDRQDIKLAVTEYATFFGDKLHLDDRTAAPEGALFLALMIFEMARQPDIVLANNWSLVNNSVFGLIQLDEEGHVRRRPAQQVFATLAAQTGNRVLNARIVSPSYSVQALGNIPAIAKVPYVDALVTEDGAGRKIVNLVNRSPDQSMEILLDGAVAGARSATVTQWHGLSAKDWKSSYSETRLAADAATFRLTLPPFSFSIVRVDTAHDSP